MKYLFFIFLILPTSIYAQQFADLNYFPSQGEFVGSTSFQTSTTELSVTSVMKIKTQQPSVSQFLSYGFTDRFNLSISLPFAISGSTSTTIGGTTDKDSLDTESLGVVTHLSFLLISDPEKDSRLVMSVHYNPKSLNDREIGYIGLTLAGNGHLSETTSWMISSTYLHYEKTESLKSFSAHTTEVSLQHYFSEQLFIRPTFSLAIESNTKPQDGSFEIHYDPRIGLGLAFGGYIGGSDVVGLLSAQYFTGDTEVFAGGATASGKFGGSVFSGSLSYRF